MTKITPRGDALITGASSGIGAAPSEMNAHPHASGQVSVAHNHRADRVDDSVAVAGLSHRRVARHRSGPAA